MIIAVPCQTAVVPCARTVAKNRLPDRQIVGVVVLREHETEKPVTAARKLKLVA